MNFFFAILNHNKSINIDIFYKIIKFIIFSQSDIFLPFFNNFNKK